MGEAGENGTREQIRRARGQFLAMAGAYSLGAFNDNFFKQAALLLAVSIGRPELQGYGVVIFTLPYILLGAPAGWLSDRFSKRHIVIAAKMLEVAAMACGAAGILWVQWPLILTMVGMMGLHATIFSPALNGSIPELYPPEYVVQANSLLRVAVTASILLGVALAGFALEYKTPAWGGIPLGRMIVAGAVLAVAGLGLAASFGVPKRPAANPAARFPWSGLLETMRELGRIGRDPILAVALAADVFVWFIGQLQVLLINQMGITQFGFSEARTSYLVVAVLVGVAAGGLIAGRYVRGTGWARLVAPGLIAMAVCQAVIGVSPLVPESGRLAMLLTALGIGGAAGGLLLIPCEAFIQVRPVAQRRGAVIAAANAAAFAGILLAGPAANGLNVTVRPTDGFAIASGLTLLIALILGVAVKKVPHD